MVEETNSILNCTHTLSAVNHLMMFTSMVLKEDCKKNFLLYLLLF